MLHFKRLFPVLAAFLMLAGLRPALAQDGTNGDPASSPFGTCEEELSDQDKMMAYSLYYEDFKNKNYTSSIPYLRKILRCAPTFAGQGRVSDRNLRRAIEAYAGLAEATDDAELKAAYLDTAVTVYDITPAIMEAAGEPMTAPEQAVWFVKKGRFMQTHLEGGLDGRGEEVYGAYEKAYEISPDSTDFYTIEILLGYYINRDEIPKAVPLFDQAVEQYGDDPEKMGRLKAYEEFMFPDDESRLEYLMERLAENPEDIELLTEAFGLAVKLKESDIVSDLGQQLLTKVESGEVEPSARLYISLGQLYVEEGDFERALEMYEQALELPDAADRKREIYYNMGLAYQNQGSLAKARTQFRQALREDSEFGPALMAIGDLYVEQVSSCASEFDFADRAVYWLATDYYQRARSADNSVSRSANQKINQYRQYYPTQEMLFFRNMEAGQSYTVNGGCYAWISESTTVKSP